MKKNSIVYATDHNFVLLCAVSILSMIQTNKKRNEYRIYILIDETLTDKDYQVFDMVWKKYPEVDHEFVKMDESVFLKYPINNTSLTKSTLYRLVLPSILKDDICLYVDADTMIEDDISEVFSLDMRNEYIAGVWDPGMPALDYHLEEIPDMDSYINAGVLLMNLKKMRADNLEKVFFEILPNSYRFNDQDVLNVSCYGHIKPIAQKFNQFAHYPDGDEKTVIRHLIGWEGCRPSQNKRSRLSKEWWDYASMFRDCECYKKTTLEADEWYIAGSIRYVLEKCSMYKKVYIWGSKALAIKLEKSLKRNNVNVLAFVDNDKDNWDEKVSPPIISADGIDIGSDTLIINTAWNARDAIKKQAMSLGVAEKQVINYKRRPAGFYTVLADEYRLEELEELYLQEYGTVRVE